MKNQSFTKRLSDNKSEKVNNLLRRIITTKKEEAEDIREYEDNRKSDRDLTFWLFNLSTVAHGIFLEREGVQGIVQCYSCVTPWSDSSAHAPYCDDTKYCKGNWCTKGPDISCQSK